MLGIYIGGSMAQSNSNVVSYFLRHMPDFVDEDVIFIDKFKVKKAERECSCDVLKFDGKQFLDDVGDWHEYESYVSSFLSDNGIDKLMVLKLPYSFGFMKGCSKTLDRFLSSDDARGSMSFVSVRNQLEAFEFVKAASTVCDYVYQYVIDPNEVTLSDYFKFKNFESLYYLDRYGCTFAPYWCYGLMEDDAVLNGDKVRDFLFYCTAEGDNRDWLRSIADELEGNCSLDINIIRKGSKKNATECKVISQELYFDMLSETRYTAVIPSYCEDTFSWMRFMEAVYSGCLPFVFSTCCLDEVRDTFPDVCDIIETQLLVDSFYDCEKLVNDMPEARRLELVADIACCKSVSMVTDIDEVRKLWRKVRGLR